MAFRRGFRRRKARVQWLPNPGTASVPEVGTTNDPLQNWSGIEFNFFFSHLSAGPQTLEAPLAVDNPVSETIVGSTLGVYQKFALNQTNEFAWRLKRIVGDLFCAYGSLNTGEQDLGAFPGILVAAGIIVRRVDGSTGRPTEDSEGQEVDSLENNADPWVWRRNWILGSRSTNALRAAHGAATNYGNTIDQAISMFPNTNTEYGSALTGTRVDQKTNRRLGPEERLFLNVTCRPLPLSAASVFDAEADSLIYLNFDYRLLGSVFTTGGNRRNASR